MKYRDNLSDAMAGPTPQGVATPVAQADYKVPADLKSCQSEFHHNTLMWTL
ncbi:MAG: hypothetical protein J5995_02720 [Muribaculaceae bacterium]|nr:hypothetical protein [Muribaculaceae bacterium]